METHVFHARFWRDSYIVTLNRSEKLYFNYLLTNEYVNVAGIYELSRVVVKALLGFSDAEMKKMEEKFQADGKFVFFEEWVRIVHFDRYRVYKGEKNDVARKRIKNSAPEPLFDTHSIGYRYPIDTPKNQKPKIRNKKSKEEGEKSVDKLEQLCESYLLAWNEITGQTRTSTAGIRDNLEFWLTQYTPDQIKQAIKGHMRDEFWKGKMTPVMLLRRKNPRGEPVDYIGDFMNKGVVKRRIVKPLPEPEPSKPMTPEQRKEHEARMDKLRKQFGWPKNNTK